MKKYLIHVIYLLVIAFFAVFANIKAQEAQKQEVFALEERVRAEKNARDAQRQAEMAAAEAVHAAKAQNLARMEVEKAREALLKCKGK